MNTEQNSPHAAMNRRTFLGKFASGLVAAAVSPVLLPTRRAEAWGAFESLVPTHSDIVQMAYWRLQQDIGPKGVSLPPFEEVAKWDLVKVSGSGLYGTGPDLKGKSPYSWHYYNPDTGQGRGPWAVEDHFARMLRSRVGAGSDDVNHMTSWACHFLADMNVPYHVVGTSAQVAYGRRGNPIFTEKDTGPKQLFSDPIVPVPNLILPPGWGSMDNFSEALKVFMNNNPLGSEGDWFDPWYYNGPQSVGTYYSIYGGSHANWEADIAIYTSRQQVLDHVTHIAEIEGFYDRHWQNRLARWGDQFYVPAKEVAGNFAKEVARRTRRNIETMWRDRKVGLAYAVRSVYTMLRASMTAIRPEVIASEREPGLYDLEVRVHNDNPHSLLRNVEVKIDLNEFAEVKTVKGNIPYLGYGRASWQIKAAKKEKMKATVQIRGIYPDCPDLGYCSQDFSFDVDCPPKNPWEGRWTWKSYHETGPCSTWKQPVSNFQFSIVHEPDGYYAVFDSSRKVRLDLSSSQNRISFTGVQPNPKTVFHLELVAEGRYEGEFSGYSRANQKWSGTIKGEKVR